MASYTIRKPLDVVLSHLDTPSASPRMYLAGKGVIPAPDIGWLKRSRDLRFLTRKDQRDGRYDVFIEREDYDPEYGHPTYNDRYATLASLVRASESQSTFAIFTPPETFYPHLRYASEELAARLEFRIGVDMARNYFLVRTTFSRSQEPSIKTASYSTRRVSSLLQDIAAMRGSW